MVYYFMQLEACIKNILLLEVYNKFAVEAFHVESVRFLEE